MASLDQLHELQWVEALRLPPYLCPSGVPRNFRQGVRIQAFTKSLLVADPERANPGMGFGLPSTNKKIIVVYICPRFFDNLKKLLSETGKCQLQGTVPLTL